MNQINGVYCAVLTPINADLSINNDLYLRHCQLLMKKGLDGLTPFGTNGEASSFSVNEKNLIQVCSQCVLDTPTQTLVYFLRISFKLEG